MKLTRADPCVLFCHIHDSIDGLDFLQVDDSLRLSSQDFLDGEEEAAKAFRCKPRTYLGKMQTVFHGLHIRSNKNRHISVTQFEKIDSLPISKTQV